MNNPATIALLFHETATTEQIRTYTSSYCAQFWNQWGFEVRILRGATSALDADVLIPQIDTSVMPPEYRELIKSSKNVVNRNILDIRKSLFSQNLVTLDDAYDGPVVVKTDRNAGGAPERSIIRSHSHRRRIAERFRQAMTAVGKVATSRSFHRMAYTTRISSKEYPVFDSKHKLPRGTFKNRDLIVEKFLPEEKDGFYYTRTYNFLGSATYTGSMSSHEPIVKTVATASSESAGNLQMIRAVQRKLGFDFGRFDYVVHNGELAVLDTNATPVIGPPEVHTSNKELMDCVSKLAEGIFDWLPNRAIRE